MLDFSFYSPTYFAFGKNSESRVGELAQRFGATKVLLHYGQGSVIRSGLLDRVEESLQEAGIETVRLGGVVPNPEASKVYEGIELSRREGVDFIIGVGGGSACDSAKAIAVGVPYDGDFWDFYKGEKKVECALPIATVITLAATGTEGSNSSVITHVENNRSKWSIRSDLVRPVFSILNPELTFTLPPYQTACGITDMIAHIMERYLTNTEGVELTDSMCLAVMKTIVHQGAIAMKNPRDYYARANLMWAGTVAHNDSLGMDREQDWSSHKLELELSALYGVAHGAGLAVMLPAFMEYQLDHNPKRLAVFASEVFDVEPSDDLTAMAEEGIYRFRAYLKSIGMPLTLRDIAVPEEDIPLLASRIQMNNGDLFGFYRPLNRQQIEEVYRLAY